MNEYQLFTWKENKMHKIGQPLKSLHNARQIQTDLKAIGVIVEINFLWTPATVPADFFDNV